MKKEFNYSCSKEVLYKKYFVEQKDNHTYILADTTSAKTEFVPFDHAENMLLAYLYIGYLKSIGQDYFQKVYDFVCEYGMSPKKKINANSFAEDAEGLYLHFLEIISSDYPENPEWILETDPVSAVIVKKNIPIIKWQTKGILSAIELAYTLMICGKEKYINACKHCMVPYSVKNPKSEFCSPVCRNRYNVYKSRSK